jgi:hypothetical protein
MECIKSVLSKSRLWFISKSSYSWPPGRTSYNAHISHCETVLLIFSSEKKSYFFLFQPLFVTIIQFIFALFPKCFTSLQSQNGAGQDLLKVANKGHIYSSFSLKKKISFKESDRKITDIFSEPTSTQCYH